MKIAVRGSYYRASSIIFSDAMIIYRNTSKVGMLKT
jgi:hypothetical protein